MRPLLIHSQSIETTIRKLPSEAAYAFGAAICQRTWPVLAAGLQRHGETASLDLQTKLTAVWRFLAGLGFSPTPIAPAFENAIPQTEVAQSDYKYFDSAAALYGFADSFDRAWPDGIIYVSRTVLALLDNFLYESLEMDVSATNDLLVDNHPLLILEMKRQKADIAALSNGVDPDTVLSIWKRSQSESLLDEI